MRYALLGFIGIAFVVQIALVIAWGKQYDVPAPSRTDPWLDTEKGTPNLSIITRRNGARPDAPENQALGDQVIQGIVRDNVDAPQGGVTVLAERRPLSPESLLGQRERGPRWSLKTDADGRFAFTTLPEGTFLLTALAQNSHAHAVCSVQKGESPVELGLKLVRSYAISGSIVDGEGAPVAGAAVVPIENEGRPIEENPYAFLPHESSKEGAFNFPHLASGKWRFLVAARGFAPALSEYIEGGEGGLLVALGDGASFQALLAAGDGTVVSGTKLTLLETRYGLETYQAKSDASGLVKVDGLRQAEYRLVLESDKYALEGGTLTVQAGAETSTVPLVLAGAVRGRVTDSAGNNGVGSVRVAALDPDGRHYAEVSTDHGGYYRLRGLPPGTVTIQLTRPEGYTTEGPSRGEVPVTSGQQAAGPDFLLRQGETVAAVK